MNKTVVSSLKFFSLAALLSISSSYAMDKEAVNEVKENISAATEKVVEAAVELNAAAKQAQEVIAAQKALIADRKAGVAEATKQAVADLNEQIVGVRADGIEQIKNLNAKAQGLTEAQIAILKAQNEARAQAKDALDGKLVVAGDNSLQLDDVKGASAFDKVSNGFKNLIAKGKLKKDQFVNYVSSNWNACSKTQKTAIVIVGVAAAAATAYIVYNWYQARQKEKNNNKNTRVIVKTHPRNA